jgi:hypothetical protein
MGLGKKYPNVNLGEYIGYFKYKTTKMINLPEKLWQRNYHEHIIRNEIEYAKIANYIENNPISWEKDCFNAGNGKSHVPCPKEELISTYYS